MFCIRIRLPSIRTVPAAPAPSAPFEHAVGAAVERVAAVEQVVGDPARGMAVVLDAVVAVVADPVAGEHEAVGAIGHERVVVVVDPHALDDAALTVDRDRIAAAQPWSRPRWQRATESPTIVPPKKQNERRLRRRVVAGAPQIAAAGAIDVGAPVDPDLDRAQAAAPVVVGQQAGPVATAGVEPGAARPARDPKPVIAVVPVELRDRPLEGRQAPGRSARRRRDRDQRRQRDRDQQPRGASSRSAIVRAPDSSTCRALSGARPPLAPSLVAGAVRLVRRVEAEDPLPGPDLVEDPGLQLLLRPRPARPRRRDGAGSRPPPRRRRPARRPGTPRPRRSRSAAARSTAWW